MIPPKHLALAYSALPLSTNGIRPKATSLAAVTLKPQRISAFIGQSAVLHH